MRQLATTIAACVLLAAVVACGGPGSNRPGVDADDAVITFETTVEDASLWINGRYIAELGALSKGVSLSPGDHRIEIRHDDYHTQYVELSLAKRETRVVAVELAEILP
jgi:hypothetical protein